MPFIELNRFSRFTALALAAALVATPVAAGVLTSPAGAATDSAALVPLAGALGFGVIVEGDAQMWGHEAETPVLVGGDLDVDGGYAITTGTSSYTDGGSLPIGLYVVGDVDFGSGSYRLDVNGSSGLRIADLSGIQLSDAEQNGTDAHLVAVDSAGSGPVRDRLPRIEVQTHQELETVVPASPIDVSAMFAQFRATSSTLANCGTAVLLTDANYNGQAGSGTIYDPAAIPAGATIYIHLGAPGTQRLDLPVSQLANIGGITFRDAPSVSAPLVINLVGTGAATWTVPSFGGVGSGTYMNTLFNVAALSSLTLLGGTLPGTLFAPSTAVVDHSSSNIDGSVVAASLQQGGAGQDGGEMHHFPFTGSLSCSLSTTTTEAPTTTTAAPTTTEASTTTTQPVTTTTQPTTSTTEPEVPVTIPTEPTTSTTEPEVPVTIPTEPTTSTTQPTTSTTGPTPSTTQPTTTQPTTPTTPPTTTAPPASVTVTVAGVPTDVAVLSLTATRELPHTGTSAAAQVTLAGTLLSAGGALVLLARRARRA